MAGLQSLAGSLGYDPVTETHKFDIKMGDIHSPELTLEEIFAYLEHADKPCIFAIDEFQQIAKVFGSGFRGEMFNNAGAVIVVCGESTAPKDKWKPEYIHWNQW